MTAEAPRCRKFMLPLCLDSQDRMDDEKPYILFWPWHIYMWCMCIIYKCAYTLSLQYVMYIQLHMLIRIHICIHMYIIYTYTRSKTWAIAKNDSSITKKQQVLYRYWYPKSHHSPILGPHQDTGQTWALKRIWDGD